MSQRTISFNLSGRPSATNLNDTSVYDTKQTISYLTVSQWGGSYPENSYTKPESYENFFEDGNNKIALLFQSGGSIYTVDNSYGMYAIPVGAPGNHYSIYKKEIANDLTYYTPVAVNTTDTHIIDYNVAAGHTYQYVAYSASDSASGQTQLREMASPIDPEKHPSTEVNWDCWSITELTPVSTTSEIPSIKKSYIAESKNVWLFKYDVESGEQTQNIKKTEQQNLGQFPRYSHGKQNNISGSVSCYLGREIIPYHMAAQTIPYSQGYVERLPWKANLTTNQKVAMLQEWRKIVASKNPKLLKDRKGQTFIVQIVSGTNKPTDNIAYQPDKINFNWVQIASTDETTITGNE